MINFKFKIMKNIITLILIIFSINSIAQNSNFIFSVSKTDNNNPLSMDYNSKLGFMDINKDLIVNYQYDNIPFIRQMIFHNNRMKVEKNKLFGFVDKDGKEVIACNYDKANNFSDGLAYVEAGNQKAFINTDGIIKIKLSANIIQAGDFSQGLAAIQTNTNKFGFINRNGDVVIEAKFDYIKINTIWNTLSEGRFFDNLCAVRLNNKWGYIDKSGNLVIDYLFDDANAFYEKLAAVKIGDKWGFINSNGKKVISNAYNEYNNFSQGFSLVKFGNSWIYINIYDENIFPDKTIISGTNFINNVAGIITNNNTFELINVNGITIKEIKLSEITKNFCKNEFGYELIHNINYITLSVAQYGGNCQTGNYFHFDLQGNLLYESPYFGGILCPFVYIKQNNVYIKQGEIIKNQNSKELDKYDYLEIPFEMIENNILEIKISEEKDEISYLDHIYLQVGNKIIQPECKTEILQKIQLNDSEYYQLQKGEYFELKFNLPANIDKSTKIQLVAKGYYVIQNI